MAGMLKAQSYTDVIFVAGSMGFSAHRAVLAAVSPTFHQLLTADLSADLATPRGRSASDSSVAIVTWENVQASSLDAGNFNLDTERLLGGSDNNGSPLCQSNNNNNNLLLRRPIHSAFSSVSLEPCEGLDHRGSVTSSLQTVVTMVPHVSSTSLQHALRFLYTGSLDLQTCINLPELLTTAEYLDIPDLRVSSPVLGPPWMREAELSVQSLVSNIQHREEFLNSDLRHTYLLKVRQRLREFCLDQGVFSDVLFQLDDGHCSAHRPILMARCEVMAAMFKGDFRESSAKVIQFPGVNRECFHQLLTYLYCDELEEGVGPQNCLALIALANRLCLPRLVALVEQRVSQELLQAADSTEQALRLLEPCQRELCICPQLHNADQLADWFLYHIAINYNDICRKSPKLLRNLHPENQAYLNRKPLASHLEFDFYERCMRERLWQEKPPKLFKRQHNNGCLCFSGGKKRAYRTV
ncbi:RHOBTB1 [Cordylochernes scorpioides]|uniref:RHOBTB1 n=1 Tax=Cordylochernes scorpioides TaxID=51811 RepID=A0ABY6LBP0_9ARAC|nr:RHOBTB1 [Cordylochernes scorpioides]